MKVTTQSLWALILSDLPFDFGQLVYKIYLYKEKKK
jgi:hypothetical protein